jgi:hypothetical protein
MDATLPDADSTTVQVDLTKLRQMLGVAVPSLLVANLAALGVLVAATTPLERPAAATAPAPRQLAVITMADGTRYLVDPSTALGQRAIRAALAAGGTVRYFTAPETSRGSSGGPGGGGQVPLEVPQDDDDGLVPIPEGSALEELIDSLDPLLAPLLTIPILGDDGSVGDVAAPLTGLLDSTSSTLTGLADDPASTVSDVATDPVSTVSGTVSGVLGALSPTTTTSTSTPGAPTTTTTAPPPTTTTTTGCLLLILCH